MAVQILRLRSSLLYDRVFPTRLGSAELAINFNATEPGLYFKDDQATPELVKVGPIHVGSTAPNAVPTGYISLSKGESWLDQTSTNIFKIYDGSTWQIPKAVVSTSASGFPSSPVDGQLHYDKSAPGLYMYNGTTSSWVSI